MSNPPTLKWREVVACPRSQAVLVVTPTLPLLPQHNGFCAWSQAPGQGRTAENLNMCWSYAPTDPAFTGCESYVWHMLRAPQLASAEGPAPVMHFVTRLFISAQLAEGIKDARAARRRIEPLGELALYIAADDLALRLAAQECAHLVVAQLAAMLAAADQLFAQAAAHPPAAAAPVAHGAAAAAAGHGAGAEDGEELAEELAEYGADGVEAD